MRRGQPRYTPACASACQPRVRRAHRGALMAAPHVHTRAVQRSVAITFDNPPGTGAGTVVPDARPDSRRSLANSSSHAAL